MATQSPMAFVNRLRNFFLAPVRLLSFHRKYSWSHTAPLLVVGQNPWLNALLTWKASLTHHEVWVLELPGIDRYNYHVLETRTFLSFLGRHIPTIQNETIGQAIQWLKEQASAQAKIVYLRPQYHPKEIVKYPYGEGWILKLTDEPWPLAFKSFYPHEKREEKQKSISKPWRKAKHAYWPQPPVFNKSDQFACHFLLADSILITSPPPNQPQEFHFLDGWSHLYKEPPSFAFGCALQIAETAERYFQQPFFDTEAILKTSFDKK